MEIESVMTREPGSCSRGDGLDVAARLLDEGREWVPVLSTDGADRVIGVVTRDGVLEASRRRGAPLERIPAWMGMSSTPPTCWPTDSAEAAVAIMRAYGVRQLLVVDAERRLRGLVSWDAALLAAEDLFDEEVRD